MQNIEIVPVNNSTAIRKIMFDHNKSLLYVQFKNSPNYTYKVDEAVFNEFKNAESKGSFFQEFIKPNFEKIDRLDN